MGRGKTAPWPACAGHSTEAMTRLTGPVGVTSTARSLTRHACGLPAEHGGGCVRERGREREREREREGWGERDRERGIEGEGVHGREQGWQCQHSRLQRGRPLVLCSKLRCCSLPGSTACMALQPQAGQPTAAVRAPQLPKHQPQQFGPCSEVYAPRLPPNHSSMGPTRQMHKARGQDWCAPGQARPGSAL